MADNRNTGLTAPTAVLLNSQQVINTGVGVKTTDIIGGNHQVNKRLLASSASRTPLAFSLAFLFAGTANCGVAIAQQAPANRPSADQATPSDPGAVGVGEIVVTAQRREQRLSEVPVEVQAQTGAQLTQAGATGTAMLAQISPAVSFTSSFAATATSFTMRGVQSIAPAGGIQPSVGVVIDDVPVARQYEAVLDLADIDRVEILAGPQGTLFGKNATAGVINIISNRPGPELAGSAELIGTTDGEINAKAMLNAPITSNISARFNVYEDYLNPLVKNLGGPDMYGKRAWGINGKLLFDLSPKTNLLLTAQYNQFTDSTGFASAIATVPGAAGAIQAQLLGAAIGPGGNVIDQNSPSIDAGASQSYTAELNSELTDHLKLVAITGYRTFSDRYAFDLDLTQVGGNVGTGFAPNPLNYPIEFYEEPATEHVEDYSYWSQEVRVNYTANRLDVVGGVYYQDYDEDRVLRTTFRFAGPFVGKPAGQEFISDAITLSKIKDQTAATFGDATVTIVPTVKLFGGLRYTYENLTVDYNRRNWLIPNSEFDPISGADLAPPTGGLIINDAERTDNNISGRAGIQWQPAPNLNFYASYNRGYKGAAANVGSSTPNAAAAIVAPEIASAYEIGAKPRFFDGRLAVDFDVYDQEIQNVQQTVVVPGTVAVALINAGALKTKGFDLDVTAVPIEGLTFEGGVVYNDARYAGNFRFACGPSATPGVGNCAANNTHSLDGTPAIGSPLWKVVTSVTYERNLGDGYRLTTRLAYNWRTAIQETLLDDPLTKQPAYGILDLSAGIGSPEKHWQVTLFVKNLTNQFYWADIGSASTIGNAYGFLPRDFKRYGGIRLNYSF